MKVKGTENILLEHKKWCKEMEDRLRKEDLEKEQKMRDLEDTLSDLERG